MRLMKNKISFTVIIDWPKLVYLNYILINEIQVFKTWENIISNVVYMIYIVDLIST